MKKYISILIFHLIIFTLHAQEIVTFENIEFKNCLLANPAINLNGDNEIQLSEALQYTGGISCYSYFINDATGLEAFENITSLRLGENLTSIDLSNNHFLEYLSLASNEITTIDLTNLSSLTFLNLDSNFIASIDLSNNTELIDVNLAGNYLQSVIVGENSNLEILELGANLYLSEIDLTQVINLRELNLTNNQLVDINLTTLFNLERLGLSMNLIEELDLSQNSNLSFVMLDWNPNLIFVNAQNGNNYNMDFVADWECPNLVCVQIDEGFEPCYMCPDFDWRLGEHTQYSTDCSELLGTSEISLAEHVKIYPNPVKDILTIKTELEIKEVRVYDMQAKLVKREKTEYITISSLPEGTYIIQVETEKGIYSDKIIKK